MKSWDVNVVCFSSLRNAELHGFLKSKLAICLSHHHLSGGEFNQNVIICRFPSTLEDTKLLVAMFSVGYFQGLMRRCKTTVKPVTISNLGWVSIVHLMFNLVSDQSRYCSFSLQSRICLIKAYEEWVDSVTAICQAVVRNHLPNWCIYLVAPVKKLATLQEQKSCQH